MYPEKSFLYPQKRLCIPKKVFCIPKKAFCTPQRMAPAQPAGLIPQRWWKGDPSFPVSEQGLRILEQGHQHVHDQLRRASADHILRPQIHSTSSGVGVSHTVFLRNLFAADPWCRNSSESWEVAVLLSLGGLSLRSGPRMSPAACLFSWAAERQPAAAEQLVTVTNGAPGVP